MSKRVTVSEAALMCDDPDQPAAGEMRLEAKRVVMPPLPARKPPPGRTPCPPEGVYPGMDFDSYCAIDAWNHGALRLMDVPLAASMARDNPNDDETDSKRAGIALHMATLEPERFKVSVIPPPIHEWTVKATGERKSEPYGSGTIAWENHKKANPGKLIMDPKELEALSLQVNTIMADEHAMKLMRAKGLNEVTMIWMDEDTGVMMKGRVDRAIEGFGWIDLKSTQSAAPFPFGGSYVKFGYATQIPTYRRGIRRLRGLGLIDWPERMTIVAVDTPNKNGFCGVVIYEPTSDDIGAGDEIVKGWIHKLKMCMDIGEFPSYTATRAQAEKMIAAGYCTMEKGKLVPTYPFGPQTLHTPNWWKAKYTDGEF